MASASSLLKQDHRAVEKLFSDFESSREPSVAERICEELDTHVQIEERIVYPVLRNEVSGGEGMVEHAEEEHSEAKQLVGRIRRTSDQEHLGELVRELKKGIEEHVQEEENEVFPKMERELGSERMEELGREIEEAKS